MITIFDVAARAGVSKSTVSLVLNSSPLVKEETRQRVQQAIKDLKYVPNYSARSLIRKNNNSIGIIQMSRGARNSEYRYEWSYSSDYFTHDVEEGIFESISKLHLDFSVMKERLDLSGDVIKLPKIIEDRRVDGAIFIGGFDKENIEDAIKAIDIPKVLVTSSINVEGIDTVFHSSYQGSKIAMQYLIETGHKKICFINCPKRYYRVWPERIHGILEASAEYNYFFDEKMIISAQENTPQSSYEAFSELLDSGLIPDAVFAANNEMVQGVMRSLYEHNLRIPDDISVICYEDSQFCGHSSPALTAINIQKEKIGEIALSYLRDRINDPTIPARAFSVDPYLVKRQSVIKR